jgi:hypothetical protein
LPIDELAVGEVGGMRAWGGDAWCQGRDGACALHCEAGVGNEGLRCCIIRASLLYAEIALEGGVLLNHFRSKGQLG